MPLRQLQDPSQWPQCLCCWVKHVTSCSFQAIDALKTAARSKPVAPMFMLLGKTQMKAKQFKEATESFEHALQLYVS